jgi:hypothetical protein
MPHIIMFLLCESISVVVVSSSQQRERVSENVGRDLDIGSEKANLKSEPSAHFATKLARANFEIFDGASVVYM